MTRDKLREIFNLARQQVVGTSAEEAIEMVNYIVNLEWEGGCLEAENEALRDAIRAAGYRITGSSFDPKLERVDLVAEPI